MKLNLTILAGTASLIAILATPAIAEGLSAIGAVTNNYIFRGQTQSANHPAVSGEFDYDFGNGFTVGTWMSSIDFGDQPFGSASHSPMELDIYANYGGTIVDKLTWSVGGIGYLYPLQRNTFGGEYNNFEVDGGLGYDFTMFQVSGKVFYNPNVFGISDQHSIYFTGGVTIPITPWLSAMGNVGHTSYNSGLYTDYTDWNLGLSATWKFLTGTVQYVDSNCTGVAPAGNLCGAKFVASLSFKVSE